MSNEIYGFADFPVGPDLPTLTDRLGNSTPLGVFQVSEDRLIGFPFDLRPTDVSFIFAIGDSKDSMNAEYILDYQDYDPQSDIKLPINADERLLLLAGVLSSLFVDFKCKRIAVCLTESNQIDLIKHLNVSQITDVIKNDCSKESPPCIIYVITP